MEEGGESDYLPESTLKSVKIVAKVESPKRRLKTDDILKNKREGKERRVKTAHLDCFAV